MAEVTLTIDGRTVTVPKGTTVYHAAKQVGIEIPIFCYHDRMPPLGACRMCFVQVEKMPRLQTACTLEAQEGMVVHTDTAEVKAAREGILEFLLINHPLDCPICDKGGECPLQDFTFSYGPGRSRFLEQKRDFPKPLPLGPVLMVDRERCILCWRCVRFCEVISGDDALEGFGRGFLSQINTAYRSPRGDESSVDSGCSITSGTVLNGAAESKFIGNTIMICPVGALTSRTYRFRARPWDTRSSPSVCMHCGLGCSIYLDVRSNEVVRTRPKETPDLNDIWLCDLGWFGYDFVNHPERLTIPLIRRNGVLEEASWDEALDLIARKLQSVESPAKVGAFGGVQATNEESYLLQKFFRKILGTNNLDHRIDATPWGAGLEVSWGMESTFADIERADAILLVGTDLTEEYPILWLRMKKAVDRGAALIVLGPKDLEISRYAAVRLLVRVGQEGAVLSAIADLCARESVQSNPHLVKTSTGTTTSAETGGVNVEGIEAAARALSEAKRPLILLGGLTLDGPGGRRALRELDLLRSLLGAPLNILRGRGNARGAAIAGVLPDRLPGLSPLDGAKREAVERMWGASLPRSRGYNAVEMLKACRNGELDVLYVMGSDPASEAASRKLWEEARAGLPFLVVTEIFLTETARQADVVLPALSFAEKEGTVTNIGGLVQRISAARKVPGQARGDGEILVDIAWRLGHVLEVSSWEEVFAEMQELIPGLAIGSRIPSAPQPLSPSAPQPLSPPAPSGGEGGQLLLVLGRALFNRTSVTSRCEGIAALAGSAYIALHPEDARRLGVRPGDLVAVSSDGAGEILAVARFTEAVPPGQAFIPLGYEEAPANALVLPDRPYTYVRVKTLVRT